MTFKTQHKPSKYSTCEFYRKGLPSIRYCHKQKSNIILCGMHAARSIRARVSKREAEQRTAEYVWSGRAQRLHSPNFSACPLKMLPLPCFLHHAQLHRKKKKRCKTREFI